MYLPKSPGITTLGRFHFQDFKTSLVCISHTSCEDELKEKKISEQTTGQALFWTYFCIRICVEANDLATSKQGLVYITI